VILNPRAGGSRCLQALSPVLPPNAEAFGFCLNC
jgi:hypothetical protein